MRILNIEDTMLKHLDIARAVKKMGRVELDHVKNLKSGLEMIEASIAENSPYDVIISDMYYPVDEDGVDADSGNRLIEILKEKEVSIPIIICSTVRFRIPEILGVVHYSANADWERELLELLQDQSMTTEEIYAKVNREREELEAAKREYAIAEERHEKREEKVYRQGAEDILGVMCQIIDGRDVSDYEKYYMSLVHQAYSVIEKARTHQEDTE